MARIVGLVLFTFGLSAVHGGGPDDNVLIEGRCQSVLCWERGVARHEGADGVYHGFAQAYKALDAEQLAENYTDQAVYLQPDGSNVIGRSSIHAGFRTFFSRLEPEDSDLTISFVVKHRWIGADQVVDRGQYTLWRGERIQQRGGFLTIVVPDRDRWRFRLDALIKLP